MKRSVGTVLTVAALLGVGSTAAALNVRMLQTPSAHENRLTLQATSNLMMSDVTAQPTPVDDVTTPAVASASAPTQSTKTQESPDAEPTNAVTRTPTPPVLRPAVVPLPSEPIMPPVQMVNDDGERVRHRPLPMSPAQMNLLRVAAVAGVTPELARAVARGEDEVGVSLSNRVKAAAELVGVPLESLASVEIPKSRERAEGGKQLSSGDRADD